MIDNPHKFQSTRPSRASTSVNLKIKPPSDISIHKALTGLDYPVVHLAHLVCTFQSTRPSRASTISSTSATTFRSISIHKALTGLDLA